MQFARSLPCKDFGHRDINIVANLMMYNNGGYICDPQSTRIEQWLTAQLMLRFTSVLQLLSSKKKELTIIVTNASRMCVEHLSPTASPQLSLRVAVRMALAYTGQSAVSAVVSHRVSVSISALIVAICYN